MDTKCVRNEQNKNARADHVRRRREWQAGADVVVLIALRVHFLLLADVAQLHDKQNIDKQNIYT
jgi:hypothetical protein